MSGPAPTTAPTPGRRVAARRRPTIGRGTVAAVLLPVLALVVVLLGPDVGDDPEGAPAAGAVAVDHRVAVCAVPAAAAGTGVGAGRPELVTLAAPVGDLAGDGTLTVTQTTQGERPAQEVEPLRRGELQTVETARRAENVTVTADGATAAGRATFLVQRGGGSLAVQECPPPRAEWWFTGGGASLDHRSQLVLVNADPGPAVVDVSVLGLEQAAPAEDPEASEDDTALPDLAATRGLTLQPGERVTLDLVELAPQAEELAVHVRASRGRVSAVLDDSFAARAGRRPGREWIPFQYEAQRFVRLAPLSPRADRRTLLVGNPTGREALVTVEVSGEGGSFQPTEDAELRVPPGAVVSSDLTAGIGRDASAVTVRSSVPVTASVRSTLRSAAGTDVSYAAALSPLTDPAAAVLPTGAKASVQLTGGRHGARARVRAFDAAGKELDATVLRIDAEATVAWQPPPRAGYVMVEPVAGRVFGGVALTGRDGVSQVPLRSLPVSLRRPVVEPAAR